MTVLDIARANRNTAMDAAEDAIAEVQRLQARVAELEALLRDDKDDTKPVPAAPK